MDSTQFESYVPVYDTVPDNWEDARAFLVEHLKKISNAVNIREIGWYLDEELLSGKQYFPNATSSPAQFRTILRKVVDFGALPNAGTKSVPHGILFDNNFTLIQLFGAATNPSNNAIPLPFAAAPPNTDIQLHMDTVNIVVTSTANVSAYTRAMVVIEYIQEI